MPKAKRAATTTNLTAGLSSQVLKNLVEETLAREIGKTVAEAADVGALFDGLEANPMWSAIQRLPLSSLSAQAPAPMAAAPVASAPQVAAAPKPAARKPGRPAKATQQMAVDDLLDFVVAHPGLRAEEITRAMGGDATRIKAGLAALFEAGKVTRGGKARGTTYAATGAAPAPAAPQEEEKPAKAAPPAKRPRATAKAAPAKPEKGKKFIRRSPEEIEKMVGKVLAFVSKNPGLRSEEIVKKLGGDAKAIGDALARLRAEDKVKTKGVKRAMTYATA